MRAHVSITSTISFKGLGRRLLDAERDVLVRHEKRILTAIKKGWRDWEYDGRPDSAPVNVSLKAWQSTIDTRNGRAALMIRNEARDWRTGTRSYVAHVHRAGASVTEASVVLDMLVTTWIPKLKDALTKVIRKELTVKQRRRSLGDSKGGPRESLAVDI